MKFLVFTLLAVAVQGLLVLFEMAALSLNQIRLQYYASIGNKRAIWLKNFLHRPSRFFGTILIGITTALQLGSECSRRFYESIHLNPDLAPLSQVLLVVIFGELTPMFIARRHPSQIALFLAPGVSLLSRLLFPLIWVFDEVSRTLWRLFGKKESPTFFSREEVAIAFKEGEDELTKLTERIFQFKNKAAGEIMIPLAKVSSLSHLAQVAEVRSLAKQQILPIYRHQKQNIIGLVYVRDLLRMHDSQPIFEKLRSPWFVTKETSLLDLLEQFRKNGERIAVLLDRSGQSCGFVTLDHIASQLFGDEASLSFSVGEPSLYIERTFSGEMEVEAFNREFHANLEGKGTLSDWMMRQFDHPPVVGETLRSHSFIFTVVEPTLRGIGKLSIRSKGG